MRILDRRFAASPLASAVAARARSPAQARAQGRRDAAEATGRRRCIGYGLVVGLNKTGDKRQTIFSAQTLANMLERFGVGVAGGADQDREHRRGARDRGAAAVRAPGARLDVTASSVGDARSLQGGIAAATPLRGADGSDRRAGAGPAVDRRIRRRHGGNSVQVNHLTVGRVPGGGLVEVGQRRRCAGRRDPAVAARMPDFSTAHRLADGDQRRARRRRGARPSIRRRCRCEVPARISRLACPT